MTTDGRAINVPAPAPVRASIPSEVASMPAPVDRLAGFERRIEAQAQRQQNFERFVTEDKGQTRVLGVTWDRPDVQNIRSFANFATGGVNINPFSSNFGMQTDRAQRSSFGRVTEDIVFGGLSYPFLIGGAAPMAGEKALLTVEGLSREETRQNTIREAILTESTSGRRPANAFGLLPGDLGGRAGREVERNEFSFLPGGTPINEAGATTLASAVIFGALGAQPSRAGTVKTSGARGPIDVEITSIQQGTASGANVRAPIAPRQTTVLRFTEQVRGAQRFTRGSTAETTLTIRPDGALSRVTNVGKFRFEIEQAPNAARAIAREFRNGELVRARDVPAIKPPKGTARITELFRSEDARTVVQPRPDVLAQTRTGGRVLQVEQAAGRGRTIVGLLEEVTNSRAVSRARKTQTTRSATALESRPIARETTVRVRDSEIMPSRVFFTELKGNVGEYSPVVLLEGSGAKGASGYRSPEYLWNAGGKIIIDANSVKGGYRDSSASYYRYRDALGHERGHAFANNILKDINAVEFMTKNARQFAGENSEAGLLQRAGLIEKTEFFLNYKPSERPAEAFAELYKARELYPNMFKELAPKLDKAFARADKVRTARVTEFGTETRVVGEASGLPRESTTVLRVGSEAQVRAQDMVQSRNNFQRGPLGLDEKGPTRSSGVVKAVKEVGSVETAFEYASVTRGQLFVERGRGRLRAGFDKIQERLEKALDFEQRRPKAQSQRVTEDLLGIERPKSSKTVQKDAAKTEGPLEVINRAPRTKGAKRGEFYVEGIDLTFTQPRGVDAALRGSSRSRTIVAPSSSTSPQSAQAFIPGFDVVPPKPRQDTMPEQVIKPLPRQDTTTVPLIDTMFKPRQNQTPVSPVPVFDFGFDFETPASGIPAAFALPFGGGGSFGWPTGNEGKQRFKNQYSPSIQGGLFKVRGTKRQATIAEITGLGVRPIIG